MNLIYHVDWTSGSAVVHNAVLSGAIPKIGRGTSTRRTSLISMNGLELSVSKPRPIRENSRTAWIKYANSSISAMLTPVVIDRTKSYLLEATLRRASMPMGPTDLSAVVLTLKTGNEDDIAGDIGIPVTLQFRKNQGANAARLNLPGLANVTPPSRWIDKQDYDMAIDATGSTDFTMQLGVNFATARVQGNVEMAGKYGRNAELLETDPDSGENIGYLSANYTSAGVVLVIAEGVDVHAMLYLREFKIYEG